ncbi:hypothetical protein L6164_021539 [Bauhinia variegata]|uniref:Uncharacterized protein n=1 Tax=Bauhinia variegata TaxID=167791 RepID=A0ACB9N085_BAUVA|nr:hypothetical protein L6164_021539 [Bauhinia variegata]
MLPRETIHKTKVFFHKTLQNFKSFFSGGYQKLPRSFFFNPFSCGSANTRTYTTDQFYNEFYDQWLSDLNRIMKNDHNSIPGLKEPEMQSDAGAGSFVKSAKQSPIQSIHEEKAEENNNKMQSQLAGKKEDLCSQNMSGGGGAQVLAEKMKELEMMDVGDVEQVLDIQEALHYYSRLTSPVYLDMVDQFFVDIHSEFSAPQPSISINRPKGRLGSIRCR